jgi:hypothetical protein
MRRQVLYGTEDAVRASALESHVTQSLLDLIKENDLAESVDLQQDGHITLLFTPEEEVQARADFAAAKEAGVQGLDSVQFVDAETMKSVRLLCRSPACLSMNSLTNCGLHRPEAHLIRVSSTLAITYGPSS